MTTERLVHKDAFCYKCCIVIGRPAIGPAATSEAAAGRHRVQIQRWIDSGLEDEGRTKAAVDEQLLWSKALNRMSDSGSSFVPPLLSRTRLFHPSPDDRQFTDTQHGSAYGTRLGAVLFSSCSCLVLQPSVRLASNTHPPPDRVLAMQRGIDTRAPTGHEDW